MLFFFYGTLTTGERLRAVLAGAPVRAVSRGWVSGALYDLGEYPGLVLRGSARVPGVLCEIDETAVSRLDDYEGVGDGLYARRRVRVGVGEAAGASIEAWTYEYLGSVDSAAPIARWDEPVDGKAMEARTEWLRRASS